MSFQSVHDMLTPPGIVRPQKFWDFLDGDSLRSWWTATNLGSGSIAMDDTVDKGLLITTGASSGNEGHITFNDIRHYSHVSSVCIAVTKANDATNRDMHAGFTEQTGSVFNTRASYLDASAATFKRLQTSVNGSTTNTDTSIVLDENWTKSKVELRASSVLISLSDTLEGISTSNVPDVALQPYCRFETKEAAAKTGNIRRMECYNT